MPFYDFYCPNCGTREVRLEMSDDLWETCPICGAGVEQVFRSPPSVIWKGRFRYMKGEPEVDIEKIEADQEAEARKTALGKVAKGLDEHKIQIVNAGLPKEDKKDANTGSND